MTTQIAESRAQKIDRLECAAKNLIAEARLVSQWMRSGGNSEQINWLALDFHADILQQIIDEAAA